MTDDEDEDFDVCPECGGDIEEDSGDRFCLECGWLEDGEDEEDDEEGEDDDDGW